MPDDTGDVVESAYYVIEFRHYDGGPQQYWWYRQFPTDAGPPPYPQYYGGISFEDVSEQITRDRTERNLPAASVTVYSVALSAQAPIVL